MPMPTSADAGHHLVERAVAAAGVDPVVLPGFRRPAGNLPALARRAGHLDPVVKGALRRRPEDGAAVIFGMVPLSRRRIDDE